MFCGSGIKLVKGSWAFLEAVLDLIVLIVETHHMCLPRAIYGSKMTQAACTMGDACDASLSERSNL